MLNKDLIGHDKVSNLAILNNYKLALRCHLFPPSHSNKPRAASTSDPPSRVALGDTTPATTLISGGRCGNSVERAISSPVSARTHGIITASATSSAEAH